MLNDKPEIDEVTLILPFNELQVGCVTFTIGASGITGAELTIILLTGDIQPRSSFAVKGYVAGKQIRKNTGRIRIINTIYAVSHSASRRSSNGNCSCLIKTCWLHNCCCRRSRSPRNCIYNSRCNQRNATISILSRQIIIPGLIPVKIPLVLE